MAKERARRITKAETAALESGNAETYKGDNHPPVSGGVELTESNARRGIGTQRCVIYRTETWRYRRCRLHAPNADGENSRQ